MRFCLRLGFGFALTAWAWGVGDLSASLASVVRSDPRTGKLVRMTVVRNSGLADAVDRIAAQYALPPELVHSVIREESNYNPNAVSPKGARGLMQLIPDTARCFGVADAFDPVENLQGGAKYRKCLLNLYQRGEITRIVVVDQLDEPPGGRTAADWFSFTLKKLFGRS